MTTTFPSSVFPEANDVLGEGPRPCDCGATKLHAKGRCKRCYQQWRRSLGYDLGNKKVNAAASYQRNKVAVSVRSREYYEGKYRAIYYRLRYDLMPFEVAEIKARGCEICGTKDGRLCIDHDHETGKIRGCLCQSCNSAIGLLGELEGLYRAITYLEHYGG